MLVDLKQVLEIIDSEPTFSGEMPERVKDQIRKMYGENINIDNVPVFIRLICDITKKVIKNNIIEALAAKEKEKLCGLL